MTWLKNEKKYQFFIDCEVVLFANCGKKLTDSTFLGLFFV